MTSVEPVAGSVLGRTLDECEQVIADGLETVLAVGAALAEVHDRHLYLSTHSTWADYCTERWGFTERTGLRRIAQFRAAEALPPGTPAPSQRSLAPPPPARSASHREGRKAEARSRLAVLERLLSIAPADVAEVIDARTGDALHGRLAVWVADFHDALASGRKRRRSGGGTVIDATAVVSDAAGVSSLDRDTIDDGARSCPHPEGSWNRLPYGVFCGVCGARVR